MDASFEWNERKDRQNLIKHGVSFFLAQEAFFDPCRVIAADVRHGAGEKRYFCLGRAGGGVLTVRFTWRGGRIRIIGAGYWRQGRAVYEKANGGKKD
ncbi:MAG: BrnT family toxin [Nitrospinae bacterium]|nr:BrnT family toxin [Nitrospinota bacterium]